MGELSKKEQLMSQMCEQVAELSKDTSRKVGTIIVDKEYNIISYGVNNFPKGVLEFPARYCKPLKYKYTEHAERSAIYSAARRGVALEGAIMFNTFFPCTECSRAIIESGIKEIYTKEPEFDHQTYGEDFKVSQEILAEAGIVIHYL